MPTQLSTRTIRAYRRLAKPLAALMKVTRSKASGPVGPATVARCNAVIAAANAIFPASAISAACRPSRRSRSLPSTWRWWSMN
jgi:hypothetical protein